jgi:CheY-like chemotaxis protein
MSHEMRTQLNNIIGITELLQDTNLNHEQQELIELIDSSSQNLLNIVNNILDISKIQTNKYELEYIEFYPKKEFQSVIDIYAYTASKKNINFSCFIDSQLSYKVIGDLTKINEVLSNLISNAIKFTNKNGLINVNIIQNESTKKDYVSIYFEVQDNGIGISQDKTSAIFEAFTQADVSISRKYGGTGLGLSIASNFVKLMGAKLDLKSVINEGSTFFFELELKKIHISNITQASFKANILVAEDNEINQKLTSKVLQTMGVSVEIANTGEEAFMMATKNQYNLIFMDIQMPVISGEVSMKKIIKYENKYKKDHVPIIALTANVLDKKYFLSQGFDEYITKPLHRDKIIEILNKFLN